LISTLFPLQKNGRLGLFLLMFGLMAVLVWQTAQWLRAPTTLEGAKHWLNVECGFGSVQPLADAWQACKLPHNWDVQKPAYSGDAWYRLMLPATEHIPSQHIPSQQIPSEQALWMFASMNAELWVNQIRLGSGGRMQEPVARHWNNALFFSIPAALLQQQHNELLIHVRGYANNSSGISALITGPYQLLHSMHQSIQFRSNLLTFGALAVTMLVGMLTIIMLVWGRQKMLIYFSLGCLSSSLYLLDQVLVNIPVSRDLWESAVHLSSIWSQTFFLLFLAYFFKTNKRWLIFTLYTYGCLAALMLLNTDSTKIIPVATVWEGFSLLFLLIAMLYMLRRWCAEGLYLALISGVALVFVIMAFMYDWLPFMLGYGANPPFLFYMGPTGFIILMGAALMVRLGNSYRYEKTLSVELGEVLWRNAKELEDVRKRADEMMRNRATLEERDRIVREIHDGVAGLLANTLTVVKPSDSHIRSQLSEALNELRMMMGTLDEDADISSLLGLQRSKLQSVIQAAGASLHWEFYDIPASIEDNAYTGMQLVRIVQECVYNALRHSQATDITVHIDQSNCWISDNGCGFDIHQAYAGRGLKNLRWRARQLKAKFDISSNASGTKISISWKK